MIAQVELYRWSSIVRMGWANPHQRNTLLLVRHMHVIVFVNLRAAAEAVMLECAVNVMDDVQPSTLFSYQFLNSLARCIVEIMCVHRWLGAFGLRAKDFQLVAVVPLEVTRGVLRAGVAVGIEAIGDTVVGELHFL